MGRVVALKRLRSDNPSPKDRARFEREARLVAGLSHPNIVVIHDYSGAESSDCYLVTEFIAGRDLNAFITSLGSVPLEEAVLLLLRPVVLALEYAHAKGVVHRDVKPENVMLSSEGVVKLMDFGIAFGGNLHRMTAVHDILGSPAFMSPEQVNGEDLDHRGDIFSLGTVAYHLATGKLPFEAPSVEAIWSKLLKVEYPDPRKFNPAVTTSFQAILDRCLRRNPNDRFSNCTELLRAIDRLLKRAGIDEPEAELQAYLFDPPHWETEFKKRLYDRWLAAARTLMRRKAGRAEALEMLSRLMVLFPGRTEIEAELTAMEQRFTRRRLLAWVLVTTFLVSGGAWAYLLTEDFVNAPQGGWFPRGWVDGPQGAPQAPRSQSIFDAFRGQQVQAPEPTAPPTAHSNPPLQVPLQASLRTLGGLSSMALQKVAVLVEEAPAGPRPVPAVQPSPVVPSAPETRVAGDTGGRRPQEPSKKRKPPSPPQPRPEPVKGVLIEAFPPAVEIWVDGNYLGNGKAEAPPLSVGRHALRLHHPACAPCADVDREFVVRAGQPPLTIKQKIAFRPATLQVRSPRQGLVFLGGRALGRVNERLEVAMHDPTRRKGEVKVVFDDMSGVRVMPVTLAPGETVVMDVP